MSAKKLVETAMPILNLPRIEPFWKDGVLVLGNAPKYLLKVDQNTGISIYLRTDYAHQFSFEADGQLFDCFSDVEAYCYRAYQAAR